MTEQINAVVSVAARRLITIDAVAQRASEFRGQRRKEMNDLHDYLRAYWAYVSAGIGWPRALKFIAIWLAMMFLPLGAKTLVQLPEWAAIAWMVGWAMLGNVFAPYGMWKQNRIQIASMRQ